MSDFVREEPKNLNTRRNCLLTAARITTVISAVWTAICAFILLSWQILISLRDGSWTSFSLASAIKGPGATTYITASSTTAKNDVSLPDLLVDGILELPAVLVLLVVTLVLTLFYFKLMILEKRYT